MRCGTAPALITVILARSAWVWSSSARLSACDSSGSRGSAASIGSARTRSTSTVSLAATASAG